MEETLCEEGWDDRARDDDGDQDRKLRLVDDPILIAEDRADRAHREPGAHQERRVSGLTRDEKFRDGIDADELRDKLYGQQNPKEPDICPQ